MQHAVPRRDRRHPAARRRCVPSRPMLISVRSSGNAAPLAGPASGDERRHHGRSIYIPGRSRRLSREGGGPGLLSDRVVPIRTDSAGSRRRNVARSPPGPVAAANRRRISGLARWAPSPVRSSVQLLLGRCANVTGTEDAGSARGIYAIEASDPCRCSCALIAVSADRARPTVSAASPAPGSEEINFLSIVVDKETADADTRLKRFLERTVTAGSTGDARPAPGEVPAADDALWRRDPGVCGEAGPKPALPGAHHAVCVCRRRDARREVEHPRRLQERGDRTAHTLPLLFRRAQGPLCRRQSELESRRAAPPASTTSKSICGASRPRRRFITTTGSAPRATSCRRSTSRRTKCVCAMSHSAQPAAHPDRSGAAGLDEQQRSRAASHRRESRSRGGVGRHQEEMGEPPARLLFIKNPTRRCRTTSLVAAGIDPATERLIVDAHPTSIRTPAAAPKRRDRCIAPANAERRGPAASARPTRSRPRTTSTRGTPGTATTAK